MFRLTRIRRIRVSNRLAVLAACLLIVAAATGMSSPLAQPAGEQSSAKANTFQPAGSEANTTASVKSRKGFRVSLYLFRHN